MLADLSDEVAGRLESGDSCGAAQAAARLREGTTEAINDGAVPEVYLEDLSGLVNEIEAQIPPCTPAPETVPTEEKPPEDEDDDSGGGATTVPETTETEPVETVETTETTETTDTTETVPTDTTTTGTTTVEDGE